MKRRQKVKTIITFSAKEITQLVHLCTCVHNASAEVIAAAFDMSCEHAKQAQLFAAELEDFLTGVGPDRQDTCDEWYV